jgi:hypothetical protein
MDCLPEPPAQVGCLVGTLSIDARRLGAAVLLAASWDAQQLHTSMHNKLLHVAPDYICIWLEALNMSAPFKCMKVHVSTYSSRIS